MDFEKIHYLIMKFFIIEKKGTPHPCLLPVLTGRGLR